MNINSNIDKAMKSIASHQSAWEKIKADLARPSGIEQAMNSIASHQSAWEKIKADLARPSAVEQSLKIIARSKDLLINNPNCLEIMAESVVLSDETMDTAGVSGENFENDFENIADELSSTPDAKSFLAVFSKLTGTIKKVVLILLVYVFFDQLNSISANLLTPVVQDFLNDNFFSNKPQISQIKNLGTRTSSIETSNIRFVTGNNVRLRESATTNSKIIDELSFGQIVTVLSKKRNWIEVSYDYEDGELLQGWIFTRYTAKFNK